MEYQSYVRMADSLKRELAAKGRVQAALLAAEPRTHTLLMDGVPLPGFLGRFCQEHSLVAASIQTDLQGTPLAECGSASVLQFPGQHTIV
jgi:hypothetical protein